MYVWQLNPVFFPACLGTWRCVVTDQGCLSGTGDWGPQQIQPWPAQDCGGCESSVWSIGCTELGRIRRTYEKQGMNPFVTESCSKALFTDFLLKHHDSSSPKSGQDPLSNLWVCEHNPSKLGQFWFSGTYSTLFEGEYCKWWDIFNSNTIKGDFL